MRNGDENKLQETSFGTSAFYVPEEMINEGRVEFPETEIHHIRNVLRLNNGDEVEVLDGNGGKYRVRLDNVKNNILGTVLDSTLTERKRPFLSAAFYLGKKERNRFAVEKLAELGCEKIFPLVGGHGSFVGNCDKEINKLKLASVAAMKQSRCPFLCSIEMVQTLENFLELCHNEKKRPVICMKCSRELDSSEKICNIIPEDSDCNDLVVVVGPEGGFSDNELSIIEKQSFMSLNLGENILRFETAIISGFVTLKTIFSENYFLYR